MITKITTKVKIDLRLKIIRAFCDKKENIKSCIDQANKARLTYKGKDERNYWPNDVSWPKMAEYMAEAGGACPYGTFKSVFRSPEKVFNLSFSF